MELFDNLVEIEEVEPDETLIPGELFCTEDFSLPPLIRAPRIHRQCVPVVIVASSIIDTPYGSFGTKLVARILASCSNPRWAINIEHCSTVCLHQDTPGKVYSRRSSRRDTT